MQVKKVLISKEQKTKYYWNSGDFHTKEGVIKEDDIKKSRFVHSHLGKGFYVLPALFQDKLEKISRGPAVMLPKDIAIIMTYTGVNKDSRILDAGTGCAMLTSHLARISRNVTSYEKNHEFLKLAQKNIKNLCLKVKLKNKDIYDGIDEKNLDIIILDLPMPWKVLPHAKTALKHGAFLVAYLPNMTQVQELTASIGDDFIVTKIVEILEREWTVYALITRPKSQMIAHTAFLCFLRKV